MDMRCRPAASGFVLVAVACAMTGRVAAQEADAKYPSLSKLDGAAETRAYKQRLRDGGAFGDAERDFVTQLVLPQLGFDANRMTIEKVRRRLPALVLGDATDAKAFADASDAMMTTASAMARKRDVEPVVRINAMLLVAELKGKDGRPQAAALPVLTAAAGDERLPMDVRIAAAAGIGRHVEAAKLGGDVTGVAKAAAPALGAMLSGSSSVAGDWLAARALAVIEAGGSPAATKEALSAAAALLASDDRSVDLRVRAAAALGSAATATSGVDAAKAIGAIRDTARAGLRADLDAARQRRDERAFDAASAGQGGGQPAQAVTDPQAISRLACRRNAWRLWICADAIAGQDGSGGLAKLLGGEAAAAAGTLAATLREAAQSLDANPDERAVEEAIEKLSEKPAAAGKPAAERPAGRPADRQEGPAAGRSDSPFGS